MWRSLLTDLESVLKGAKPADLIRVPKSGPASRGEDAAAFSEWLPYRAWIADRQVFVNLDANRFKQFSKLLDAPPGPNLTLERLLTV